MKKLFWAFCSLKMAIAMILSIAAALAAGTVLESLYDTATGQYYVYRSWWFHGLLATLGLEIFAVAMSRLPWKRGHIPFLLAHLGIIILLFGSWVTEQYGLDGSLRITEGEVGTVVEVNQPTLALSESGRVKAVPVRWTPTTATFSPLSVPDYELRVDQFITHADPVINFIKNTGTGSPSYPAVHLQLAGGPMRIKQDFWLWAGDVGWSSVQAGPSRLILDVPALGLPKSATPPVMGMNGKPGPVFKLTAEKDGTISYRAQSSEGKIQTGKFTPANVAGQVIHPAWKGNVVITLLEWIPNALANTTYKPSSIEFGEQAPPSAIHISVAKGGPGSETWLGLGDRAVLQLHGREVAVGYYSQRFVLPYGIKLERFTVDHNDGTRDPSAYSSRVSVVDSPASPNAKASEPVTISMNEPLDYKGVSFYQASYEDAQPRPVVSILSVNRDPGRWLKYTGSLLIVLGTILLFAVKYRRKKLQPSFPPEVRL